MKNLRIINSNPSLGYLTIQKQLLHLFSSVIILLPRFITLGGGLNLQPNFQKGRLERRTSTLRGGLLFSGRVAILQKK